MEFQDLLDYCQALAIANKLEPTEDAVWRTICRSYSKKFNTPLHEVMKMDPEHVVLNHYEDQMGEIDLDENLEQLLDVIYTLEDPEYEKEKAAELDDFIEKTEKEEQERVKAGKPIHPAMKKEVSIEKTLPKVEQAPEQNLPTGGSIDLSYLESEESGGSFES